MKKIVLSGLAILLINSCSSPEKKVHDYLYNLENVLDTTCCRYIIMEGFREGQMLMVARTYPLTIDLVYSGKKDVDRFTHQRVKRLKNRYRLMKHIYYKCLELLENVSQQKVKEIYV